MQNGRVGYDSTIYHPNSFGIGFEPSKSVIEPSAIIEMQSSNKGLLIPRMTTEQILAIEQPANSLLVYNTTDISYTYYDATTNSWIKLGVMTETDRAWESLGGFTYLINYDDYVGIGTNEPFKKLHIYTTSANENLKSTLRLQTKEAEVHRYFNSVWDIENNNDLMFNYASAETDINPTTQTKVTFRRDGKIDASGYMINGVDIANTLWTKNTGGIFYNSGNVGIGNENPNAKLEISNNLYEQWTTSINNTHGMGNGLKITAGNSATSATIMQLETNDNYPAMIVKSTGKVGIGTNTPTASLNINSDEEWLALLIERNSGFFANTKAKIGISSNDGGGAGLRIMLMEDNASHEALFIKGNGNIGVGNTAPNEKLEVTGNIIADIYYGEKLRLEITDWQDEVFYPEYELMTIDSLEMFVKENHHLPEIPSEQQVIEDGLDVGDMQTLQMQKIEELTLYIIELNNIINEQQKEIIEIKEELKTKR